MVVCTLSVIWICMLFNRNRVGKKCKEHHISILPRVTVASGDCRYNILTQTSCHIQVSVVNQCNREIDSISMPCPSSSYEIQPNNEARLRRYFTSYKLKGPRYSPGASRGTVAQIGRAEEQIWKYIFAMSAERGIRLSRNWKNTPRRLVSKSRFFSNELFSETPLNSADVSWTTRNFSGLLEFTTPWCGRYHTLPGRFPSSHLARMA